MVDVAKLGSDLCDFKFNPFNDFELATATEDGRIRVFTLPKALVDDSSNPVKTISAHQSRVNQILYHPFIDHLLVSSSFELGQSTIKVWNMETLELVYVVELDDKPVSITMDLNHLSALTRQNLFVFEGKSGKLLNSVLAHEGRSARLISIGDNVLSMGYDK